MNLESLLQSVPKLQVVGPLNREITSMCYDSRRVQPGSLFVALKGETTDGSLYISQAMEKGAVAVLSEQAETHSRATFVVVKSTRLALADIAANFFHHPSRAMKIAGVTGTNGKTTTVFLLKHICDRAMWRCGVIGTVHYQIGDRILPATRTTPESLDVQDLLWQMRSAGCKAAAMEVSSHALDQARVRKVEFDAAIFTNLSQDHLDYHKSMEAYAEAKARFFSELPAQKKKAKAVINVDDRIGAQFCTRFARETPVIAYGCGMKADFRASNIRMDMNGTSYQLDANGRSYLVRLPLIGQFNVYNSLAAIAGAHVLGVEVREAVLALADSPPVPGRMEAVPGQRQFRVFVDYAHSEDALQNVLKTCRELNPARIIVVFGCGGSRDRGKRPKMGAVVDQFADWAIVTSDNPRKEEPDAIIGDIKPGMVRGNYEVLVDRKDAIFKAIAMAQPRDIVLIAGKGHEKTQEFADHTVPFDDVATAVAALEGKRGDW
jgi:UDP-N-acetylmuramoyl-L-alanyl-D-glutamate--2,6-diaminopimelate ligase